MWGALVFFALLSGVLDVNGEFDCETQSTQCQHHLPVRKGFPGSVEEFERSCSYILAYFNCLVEYVDACGMDNVAGVDIFPETLTYMRDACDSDSDTHAGVKKHLPCLQAHLDNQDELCKYRSSIALDSYKEANADNDEIEVFRSHEFCYRTAAIMACYIARIEEQCEAGAKEFVFDAFRRTRYLDTFCHKQNSEKRLELLEVLKLDWPMKYRIKELLEN